MRTTEYKTLIQGHFFRFKCDLKTDKEFFGRLTTFLVKLFNFSLDSSWEIHRKILENSFTKDMIRSFVPTFVSCADKMIKSLEKAEDKDKIEILKFVSRCSLTAILATSFGLSATEVEFSDDILKAVEE